MASLEDIRAIEKRILELEYQREAKVDDKLREKGLRNIKAYRPHEKQEMFHRCDSLIRIVHGGNDSGKTLCGAIELVWWATKTHPFKTWVNEIPGPGHFIVLVVDHIQQKMAEGPQDKLMSWMPESAIENVHYFRQNIIDTIMLKNGATITFKTSRQERSSLQGGRFRAGWVDEECIPSESYWNELITRVAANERFFMWMTATPGLEPTVSWMEDAIYAEANKPESDVRLFEMSMLDNPHLTEQAKKDIQKNLQGDSEEINARIHGIRRKRGRVYEFHPKIHVIPRLSESDILRFQGIWRIIDPHEAKPIAVGFGGIDQDRNFIFFDELNDQGLVSQIAERIHRRSHLWKHLVKRDIIDWSGNKGSRTGEGKSITGEFRTYGIAAHNAVKDVMGGISLVTSLLYHDSERQPRLYVTANCTSTIREFATYCRDREGKIVKKNDEFMDIIRYWVSDISVKPYTVESGGKRPTVRDMDELTRRNEARKSRLRRRQEAIAVIGG